MSARRVVVTGLGIVSSIGNNASEVLAGLREGRSGIEYCPEYAEQGLRSRHVINTRIHALKADAAAPPIAEG